MVVFLSKQLVRKDMDTMFKKHCYFLTLDRDVYCTKCV